MAFKKTSQKRDKHRLVQKGKYYELPIVGLTVSKCVFDGCFSTIVFADEIDSFLEIEGQFKFDQYGKTMLLEPSRQEAMVILLDLLGTTVTKALSDGEGNLSLSFSCQADIMIENRGPYETWHYTKKCFIYAHGTPCGLVF